MQRFAPSQVERIRRGGGVARTVLPRVDPGRAFVGRLWVQELTGLDFKPSGDSGIEKRLERRRASGLWEPSVVDIKQRRAFVPACRS